MEDRHAGGRNTQQMPPRAENSLEMELSKVAGAVSALLAHAQTIDPERDEYGHARSRAYDDAINLLKVSAKVGHSIANLRGNKFEHAITVRREQGQALNAPAPVEDENDDEPDWELRRYKGHDYDPSVRFKDGKVFVRGGPGFSARTGGLGRGSLGGRLAATIGGSGRIAGFRNRDGRPGGGGPPTNFRRFEWEL